MRTSTFQIAQKAQHLPLLRRVSILAHEGRKRIGDPIQLGEPEAIAASPDGKRVYVVNSSGRVSVIDTKSFAVATVSVGDQHSGIAVRPVGRRVCVCDTTGRGCALDASPGDLVVAENLQQLQMPELAAVRPGLAGIQRL